MTIGSRSHVIRGRAKLGDHIALLKPYLAVLQVAMAGEDREPAAATQIEPHTLRPG